jgi:hypothetical protein
MAPLVQTDIKAHLKGRALLCVFLVSAMVARRAFLLFLFFVQHGLNPRVRLLLVETFEIIFPMGTAVLDFFQCFGVTGNMLSERLPTVFLLSRLCRSNQQRCESHCGYFEL